MCDKFKVTGVKAQEAWVDGSKEDKVSYSVYYGDDRLENFKALMPLCHPQSNN